MSYMRHHAIVVTSWNDSRISEAHTKASEIFKWVSPLSPPMVNEYRSFFIPPDGSKEGWQDSNEGDVNRRLFVDFLRSKAHEDGSNSLDWIEVEFGGDEWSSVRATTGRLSGQLVADGVQGAA